MYELTHEAFNLIERLNNAPYRVLLPYANLPYAEARAYDDPRYKRLVRVIERAQARVARRRAKPLHTRTPAE